MIVGGLLSKTTLDIIGVAALGYELNSLSTSSPLAKSYETVFEFATPMQILINILHRYIPIRNWLPIKTNQDFIRANETTRRIIREQIRTRREEFQKGTLKGEKAGRDLLTLMIEESRDTLSEDDMLGYVSLLSLRLPLSSTFQRLSPFGHAHDDKGILTDSQLSY